MAFPVIAATNTSLEDAANVTSHTVNLPAGIVSGNLLIVVFNADGTGVGTFPAGDWTVINSQGSGANRLTIAYRQADGGEGSTITVTTAAAERSAHVAYRITGHEDPATQAPQDASTFAASGVNPDPPDLTPTGGAKDYLWIAIEGHDRDRTTDAFPTNYVSNQLNARGTGANSVAVAMATDEVNAASENPGTFTISASDQWAAVTIAVHPGSVDVVILPPVGAITVTGQIPVVASGKNIAIPVDAVSISDLVPTVGTSAIISPPLATNISITGLVPAVSINTNVNIPLASISISNLVASIETGVTILPPLGTISIGDLIPVISIGIVIVPPLDSISISNLIPAISIGVNVSIPLATITISDLIPSVAIIIPVNVGVPLDAILITNPVPLVGVGAGIVVPIDELTISGLLPFINSKGVPIAQFVEFDDPSSAKWVNIPAGVNL